MPTKHKPPTKKRKMSAADRLRRMDADPLVYLAHVMKGTETPDAARMDAAKALLPHAYAKLRSVEVDVAHQHDIVVRIGASHADMLTDARTIDADAVEVTASTSVKQSLTHDSSADE